MLHKATPHRLSICFAKKRSQWSALINLMLTNDILVIALLGRALYHRSTTLQHAGAESAPLLTGSDMTGSVVARGVDRTESITRRSFSPSISAMFFPVAKSFASWVNTPELTTTTKWMTWRRHLPALSDWLLPGRS